MFGDAQNPITINSNKIKFTVNQATQNGIVVVITRPNTTNIDLREAFEADSTATFGTNFTNAIKMFQALRFSSWAIGREYDYNPIGLYNDSEWETRY